ncbi:MAG: hypothetical protein M3R55_16455 [Acidobacteriota bacterium]|nr:hypothetical protein [Acidobacteriota bacterium]
MIVAAAYFTLIALTPRTAMMPEFSWLQLLPLSVLYLAMGIWGFEILVLVGARRGDQRGHARRGVSPEHGPAASSRRLRSCWNILTKLDVRDRTQAAIRARQLGLV